MDFLNKAVSQVSDLFKGMTPGARMTAGMLLAMVVISLVYLIAFQTSEADRYLYGSQEFTDSEIARMQQAFAGENLDDYLIEGKRIRVPRARMSQYLQALTKAGYSPEDIEKDIEDIREYTSSFLLSEKEKEYWREQAQQQKLARAIGKRPEIDWATVQYREVKTRGFPVKVDRSAAVVACGTGGVPLDRSTMRTIRTLASSWFGIRPEEVAINDVNGDTLSQGDLADGLTKEARTFAAAKSNWDTYFKNQIMERLAYIGPGVYAIVNVELDPTTFNESKKVEVDPRPVAIESTTLEKTSATKPLQGGQPGAVPNEVPGNKPLTITSGNNQESTSDESREQQQSVTGHEETVLQTAGLGYKKVTASVSIPRSYVLRVFYQEKDTPADTDPPKANDPEYVQVEGVIVRKIEEQIVKTIPALEAGENQYPDVDVSTYHDFEDEEPEPPSMAVTAMAWLSGNWKTLGLFVVGLVSLLVLRSMIRNATSVPAAQSSPVEPPMPDLALSPEEEEDEEEPQVILQRKGESSGMSLRDELINMVREDPDAAANVLRTWIGDAA